MKQYEFLIIINVCLVVIFLSSFSGCGFLNGKDNSVNIINFEVCKEFNDSVGFLLVDKFPDFEYLGVKRQIQPNKILVKGKVVNVRDSLLSIYLEDCVNRIHFHEGILQFDILLSINESGIVTEAKIVNDVNKSDIYHESVIDCLTKIRFNPAVLNSKYTSVTVLVNVRIDLYNVKSRIKEDLIR